MERFEGNGGLVAVFVGTALLLLALVGGVLWALSQAAPQGPSFTLLTALAAVFLLGGLTAAAVFLVYYAREIATSFTLDDSGITARTWGRTTSIHWFDIARIEEFEGGRSKRKIDPTPLGRCVLHGVDGKRIPIRYRLVENAGELQSRLEPHLAPIRQKQLLDLARHGTTLRPYRSPGIVFLTCIAPCFVFAGFLTLELGDMPPAKHASGGALPSIFLFAVAPLFALLGIEMMTKEWTVSDDRLAFKSLFRKRSIPFTAVESIAVTTHEDEGAVTERAKIKGNDGQSITLDSTMLGYRTLLDLVRTRSALKPCSVPSDAPEFS